MTTVNNFEDLFKELNKQISQSMKTDVADTVKKVESAQAKEELSKYNPRQYNRRSVGGIDDPNNMIVDIKIVSDQAILTVTNITRGADEPTRYIADLIEYGDASDGNGGEYGQGSYTYPYYRRDNTVYTYLNPRPISQSTIDELLRTNEHVESLKNSLNRKGFDVN